MHTADLVDENVKKIGTLFPNCLTETVDETGNLIKAIDFDMLKQELSKVVVDGPKERYQFTWPEKKKSILLANTPISATLRPCKEESVNFDATENLYIEGDNLDVLKLLQETYLGKVKMIYIDPPYNTGNDFVYEDDFDISADIYKKMSGNYDEQGNQMVKNFESNGRFHTDWLNMIYSRLKLARDMLTDDGVVFISIDDNEQSNLKKICDEIFGEQNFLNNIIWQKKYSPQNDAKWLSDNHDFILGYARNKLNWMPRLLPRTEEMNARYINPDNDPKGPWKLITLHAKSGNSNNFSYTFKNGIVWSPPSGTFPRFSKNTLLEYDEQGKIWFGKNKDSVPAVKNYLSEVKQGVTPLTIWTFSEVGHNQTAREDIKKCFDGNNPFDTPKPISLIKRILYISGAKDSDIILDFFSGSATTAHAVMQLNAEDGGNRKFIMVQIPENCDESSEAFKAGYKNICEIGKERIRRAGRKIKEEAGLNGQNLDIGFRVLKLDSSNMKDVYYTPAEYVEHPELFDRTPDNIKPNRTDMDLLFQIMLDLGVLLSSKIEETTIAGKKIYSVMDDYLLACFDTEITDETVTAVARKKPYYAVFRDSSFATDAVAANFEQIFATYSP